MFRPLQAATAAASVAVLAVSSTNAAVVDLSAQGSSGTINGALYQQFTVQPTGTGVIDSFVRVQSNAGVERGYNTDFRPLEFDENNSPNFTRSLLLSAVPVVGVNGTNYREFLLDVNEAASKSEVTLEQVQIYLGAAGNLIGYPNLGTLVYDMDAGADSRVELDYNTSSGGSGKGDMLLLVPDANFQSSTNEFVYLFSKFSNADAGFEEWAVSGGGTGFSGGPPIPEPAGTSLLVLSGLALLGRRRHSRA